MDLTVRWPRLIRIIRCSEVVIPLLRLEQPPNVAIDASHPQIIGRASSPATPASVHGLSPAFRASGQVCAKMPAVPAIGVVLTDRLELRPWSPSDKLNELLAD